MMRDRCNSMSYVDSAHHLSYFRYRPRSNILFLFFITHDIMAIATHGMTIDRGQNDGVIIGVTFFDNVLIEGL